MRNYRTIAFLLSLLPSLAAAAGSGVITGTVLEKSAGKKRPSAGVIVQLSILRGESQIAGARIKTDQKGTYRFADLETDAEYGYQVSARPKNVPFGSNVIQFSGQSNLKAPDILIQSVTGSLEDISVEEVVLYEFGQMNLMKVTHSLEFHNSGATLYDGRADGATQIEAQLPEQGMSLEISPTNPDDKADLEEGKNILKMTVQVPPGGDPSRKMQYAYILPYAHHDQTIGYTINARRSQLTVASMDKKISIESAILKKGEERNRDGKTFYIFTGGPVPAGTPVTFVVRGLPLNTDTGHRFVFITFALILAGVGFLLIRGKKKDSGAVRPGAWKAHYLGELAELERRLQSGQLSPDEYEEEKLRLRDLLFDLESGESGSVAA